MLLHTLGSLVLVLGVSYHIASASWFCLLLTFFVAGVGYGAWRIQTSLFRRAQIKDLWRRADKWESVLDSMEDPYLPAIFDHQPPQVELPPAVHVQRSEQPVWQSAGKTMPVAFEMAPAARAEEKPAEAEEPRGQLYKFPIDKWAKTRPSQEIALKRTAMG